jgi:hypothetical protein
MTFLGIQPQVQHFLVIVLFKYIKDVRFQFCNRISEFDVSFDDFYLVLCFVYEQVSNMFLKQCLLQTRQEKYKLVKTFVLRD